jgi:asparagine synthase (glutamine-hydrolysing)
MCGISGIVSFNAPIADATAIKRMTDVIAHRGPDGDGHFTNASQHIALGHRRLSIIDLSHAADQPMHYLDRYVIVFNGEIYNYIELKEELHKKNYTFKTSSDTEVLMALYDCYKQDALQKLDGMFAFAIYDKQEKKLFCARDRFGEKPFFYAYKPNEYFVFGSEMKSLWAYGIPKVTNQNMLFNYISIGALEDSADISRTFYDGIKRLPHGHYIQIEEATKQIDIKQYYKLNYNCVNNTITLNEAKEKLHFLLSQSIQRRLRSDVSVGSSLSGGLDSSLIVCLIDKMKQGAAQQHTFSAVFPGFKKDERKYMDYVINQTNVKPHFITPTDDDLLNKVDKIFWHQEEPFGSASIFAQYSVMGLAKANNTIVLLDGQGADEILGGYHYYYPSYFRDLKNNYPNDLAAQQLAYQALHKNNTINGVTNERSIDKIRGLVPGVIPTLRKVKNKWDQFKNPVFAKAFYQEHNNQVINNAGNHFNTINEHMHQNLHVFGMQQLLRYADRNSMAHSIEVRLPFLYHELIEFVYSLPPQFKINNGWTKWLMRETFTEMPDPIRWRVDKIGYEPPQKNWLDNKFIQDKITSIAEKGIKNELFDKNILNQIQKSHAASEAGYAWRLLMTEGLMNDN